MTVWTRKDEAEFIAARTTANTLERRRHETVRAIAKLLQAVNVGEMPGIMLPSAPAAPSYGAPAPAPAAPYNPHERAAERLIVQAKVLRDLLDGFDDGTRNAEARSVSDCMRDKGYDV